MVSAYSICDENEILQILVCQKSQPGFENLIGPYALVLRTDLQTDKRYRLRIFPYFVRSRNKTEQNSEASIALNMLDYLYFSRSSEFIQMSK